MRNTWLMAVNALMKHSSKGVKVKKVSCPHTKHALPCYYIIATAEAASNLARYQGLFYGTFYSTLTLPPQKKKLGLKQGDPVSVREKGFGPEVKRRIRLGHLVLTSK